MDTSNEASKRAELIKILEKTSEESAKWHGGEMPDGAMQMPFVTYHPAVREYTEDFCKTDLANRDYGRIMDKMGWWDEKNMKEAIPTMTVEDVYTCLTAIIRQERFCDGLIARFVKNGIFLMLLKRIDEAEKER